VPARKFLHNRGQQKPQWRSKRVEETDYVIPCPIDNRRISEFNRLAAGVILVNPKTPNRDALFFRAFNLPTCAISLGSVSADERDHPVTPLYLCSAVSLPRRIPRFFCGHVCEVEWRVLLVLRLINQVVSGKLILDRESDENAFIFCHLSPGLCSLLTSRPLYGSLIRRSNRTWPGFELEPGFP
jgi:hypothetical protein